MLCCALGNIKHTHEWSNMINNEKNSMIKWIKWNSILQKSVCSNHCAWSYRLLKFCYYQRCEDLRTEVNKWMRHQRSCFIFTALESLNLGQILFNCKAWKPAHRGARFRNRFCLQYLLKVTSVSVSPCLGGARWGISTLHCILLMVKAVWLPQTRYARHRPQISISEKQCRTSKHQ